MKKVFFGTLALALFAFLSCSKYARIGLNGSRNFEPKSGVYYSIFVRSFSDSNGDGIGDFDGILAKLDYIEELGVTGICLLPIFEARSYHGFDVVDYFQPSPDYGTMDEFERLCDECRRRSIAVLLDMPLNNFSAYNLMNLDTYDAGSPDEAPAFDCGNPKLKAEFRKVLAFWLSRGASGFRFLKADGLAAHDGQERAAAFWAEMTDYVLSVKPSAFVVGEIDDSDAVRADYAEAFPSILHYDLGEKIIEAITTGDASNKAFAVAVMNAYKGISRENKKFVDAPFLTGYSQDRTAVQFNNDPDSIKLAASLYLFLPGIPFVFYGEELGMNGYESDEQILAPFLWSKISGDFQTSWVDSKYNIKTLPVDVQNVDRNSILNYYKSAIEFRVKNQKAFVGAFVSERTKNPSIISWIIVSRGRERIWCFFNISQDEQSFKRPDTNLDGKILFCQKNGAAMTNDEIKLPPKSMMVFGHMNVKKF